MIFPGEGVDSHSHRKSADEIKAIACIAIRIDAVTIKPTFAS